MSAEVDELRVFVSWSGERSKTIALALHSWLRKVTQGARYWVSPKDIEGGSLWDLEIAASLRPATLGSPS